MNCQQSQHDPQVSLKGVRTAHDGFAAWPGSVGAGARITGVHRSVRAWRVTHNGV